ncbi:uncharacterized protein LOC112559088 isoform X2 [Pomacea canaliculata]|uniref:uncharacterized protein LOC112559088 isoform X2 n=1 Tax=Pomacea canaliculata TaxID=400727 RepID=UPI000D73CACC|nr:uncharacterized protein LOC112559088 isoform X2 [Pomacea canaliculata]
MSAQALHRALQIMTRHIQVSTIQNIYCNIAQAGEENHHHNSLIKKSIENDDNKDSEKEQQIWSIQTVKPQIITSRDTAIPRALAEWIQKSVGLDSQDIEQKGVTEWDLVSDENPATGVIRSSMIESSQNVVREQSLQTSCIDKQVKRLPIFFDLDAEENIHKLENSIRASEVSIQALDCDSRVAAWLASLGLANVATFQQIFAEHQVDFSDLYFLTVSMLQEMGISRLGPIMKILRGIDKLKEEKENKLVQLDKVENKMLRRDRSKRAWPETGDDRGQERGKKDSLPRRRDCVSKSFKRDHIGSQNKKSVEKALQLEKFDDHKTLTADNAKTISSKKIYSLLCDGGSESYSAWRNPSIVTPSFDQNLTSKALVEKTKSKTSLKFSKPSSVISSRTAVSCVQNRDCKSSYKTDVKFKNETSDVKETSHQDTLQPKTSNGGLSTACVLKRKSAKSQQESKGDILDQHPDQLHNAMAARNKVTDHSKVADNDLESSQSNQQLRDPQAEQQISYREETLNAVRDLQHKLQQLEHCILHKKTTSTSSVAAGATLKKTDAAYNLDFRKTDHTGDLYYSELQRALTNTKRNVTSVSKGNQCNGLNNTVTVGHANDIYSNGCSAWGTQNHDSVTEDSICEDVHGTVKHKQQKEDSEDLKKRSGVSKHQQNSIGGLMNKSSRMEKEMHVPEEVLVVAGMKCGRDENDGEDSPDRCITEIVTFEKKQPMSKRQLRDEIRRERDEHRKNVRHLKLELSKLQHYDPMKNSEIDRATILFRESDLIGEGSFSQVFKGQYQGAEVAVKRLRTPLCLQDRTYFASEVSLLRDLRHPCVVLLIGISTADSLPIMVLEYMAGRDLYTLIHDSNRHILDHAEFYQIARDVGSGMVYLHHHHPPVLHLNLKSMNVLLTTSHHAKIADFGFSKLKHDADKKVKKATRNKNIKVSPAWMAPELLHGGEITPKADVFSFGIILWEMMSGKHPYEGCTVFQILELVRTNKRPDICETCPADLHELISVCWAQNPAVRPNFKEVLQKIEDLSFPAGWRELFKDARIPNEALEDVPSTTISYISHLDASDSKNPTTLSGTIKAKQDGEVKGEEHIEKYVHAEKNSCARLSAREARRLGVSRRSSDVWSSSSCASTGENRGLATASDDGLSDMQGLTAYVLNDSSLAGNKLMDSRLLLDLNNNSDTDTAESNVTAGGTHQELVSVNMNVVDQNSSQPDACVVPVENDVRDICEGKVQGHKEEDGYKHIKGVKNSGSLSSSCAIIPPPPPPPPPPPLAASSTPHFSTAQVCQNGFLADVQDDSQQSVSKETLASSSKHSLKERYRGNPHISVEASELMRQKDQLRPTAQPHPSQLQEVSTTAQEFTSLADIFKKAMVNRRFAMEGNSLATSTNSQEFSDVNWSLQED